MVRAEGGHVWVTWIDSATHVAWSTYDAARDAWSLPRYEPYDGVAADLARAAVRTAVLAD